MARRLRNQRRNGICERALASPASPPSTRPAFGRKMFLRLLVPFGEYLILDDRKTYFALGAPPLPSSPIFPLRKDLLLEESGCAGGSRHRRRGATARLTPAQVAEAPRTACPASRLTCAFSDGTMRDAASPRPQDASLSCRRPRFLSADGPARLCPRVFSFVWSPLFSAADCLASSGRVTLLPRSPWSSARQTTRASRDDVPPGKSSGT